MAGLRIGPLDEHDTWWWFLVGFVLLVTTAYAAAGLGALAVLMAPVLLGPSQTEQIAALEAGSRRLAERHRLARDLARLDRTGLVSLGAKQLEAVTERGPGFVTASVVDLLGTSWASCTTVTTSKSWATAEERTATLSDRRSHACRRSLLSTKPR